LLRIQGYPIEADGVFGSDTAYAVRRFQTLGGLTSDGIVGPTTWAALIQDNQVETGSRGDAVRAVQYLLTHVYGYSITVNGIFDADTDRAVRDFQAWHGLEADGLVGPHTWKALVARP
jgi:peptidoglycan hydrolase-like protein with peptidoglycan-binding domain